MNTTISVSDAAKIANVLPAYLYQLLTAGRLKGEKVAGKWHVDRKSFETWRESHRANRRTEESVLA